MCNCSVSGKVENLFVGLLWVEEIVEVGKIFLRGNGIVKLCFLGFFFMIGMIGGGGMSFEDCFLLLIGVVLFRFKMEEF